MKPADFRDPLDFEAWLGLRPSSPAWRATIRAFYGTPLDADEREAFDRLAGGREPPEGGALELEVVAGRRGGKSETIARLATFECLFGGHELALAPGQVGLFAVISPLREQSAEILNYAKGLASHPKLRKYVARETTSGVEFTNGVGLRVFTCDSVAVVGPTVIGAIRDEWARWPGDESTTPDTAVENSLRPALAPVAGAPPRRLVGITSAFVMEGLAYATEQDHFGRADAPVLVVRGCTEDFNPNIDRRWLARERERVGPTVFAREYGDPETGPVWQPSITEGWIPGPVVESAVDWTRRTSPPVQGIHYVIGIDQAFKGDRFAIAVAHAEQRNVPTVVLDHVEAHKAPRKGAPLSVETMVQRVCELATSYGVRRVLADQFAFQPLAAVFARHGIYLEERAWTSTTKPQLYRMVRDGMRDGWVRLVDHRELVSEFCGLRGKMTQSGTESIQARAGHDDLVSASVLALSEARQMPLGPVQIHTPERYRGTTGVGHATRRDRSACFFDENARAAERRRLRGDFRRVRFF